MTHPEWIFCDDFEDGTPLVREGRYFEHDDNNGDFVIADGTGLNGSKGMRARWQTGGVGAGSIKLAFGRNPSLYMNKGIRASGFRSFLGGGAGLAQRGSFELDAVSIMKVSLPPEFRIPPVLICSQSTALPN